ncbi:retropepsin-like domain-containing protein [Patescibacteria group bacterium]|nr:retropepsin-like domain-containing protein [Patescibacteria group bacterium]
MQDAFTTRYKGLTQVLHTQIGVCLPYTKEEIEINKIQLKEYLAIWDTGATHSAITKKVADELGLKPTGLVDVRHAKGLSKTNTYYVNIELPSHLMIGNVRVTEVELIPDANTSDDQQPQILIGMDIIGLGDFAVTNYKGNTILTFRTPSIEEIDFVPEAKEDNIMEGGNSHARKVQRAKKRRRDKKR